MPAYTVHILDVYSISKFLHTVILPFKFFKQLIVQLDSRNITFQIEIYQFLTSKWNVLQRNTNIDVYALFATAIF